MPVATAIGDEECEIAQQVHAFRRRAGGKMLGWVILLPTCRGAVVSLTSLARPRRYMAAVHAADNARAS